MRIVLDREQLLGLETSGTELDVPANAAKVGTKTVIVGVPSASHADLVRTAPSLTKLTFPIKTA